MPLIKIKPNYVKMTFHIQIKIRQKYFIIRFKFNEVQLKRMKFYKIFKTNLSKIIFLIIQLQAMLSNWMEFTFDNYNLFEGILNYLDGKSFRITSSSVYHNEINSSPLNVIDFYDYEDSFSTEDEPNSWICFDFINQKVILNKYVIRSSSYGPGLSHLKSWVVEGSNDKNVWHTIDERKNCSSLNGSSLECTFNCRNLTSGFQYIRLRQTGLNWRNRNYLKFNAIEFYGKIGY